MKKNDSSERRIKELISKAAKTEIEKTKKKRAYQEEKSPPIPSSLERVSLQSTKKSNRSLGKAKIIPQKLPKVALEQMHCTHNQNYPLFFIEKAEALHVRRIRNVKVKERFIAARNLKNLSYQMQVWMHKEVKILGKDSQEFYDLLRKREERHFQIDRIIRYLSEP